MKLLLFSDIHRDLDQCQALVDMAAGEAVDLVIGAGDFGSLRQGLPPTIEVLSQILQPAILVPGNSESDIELMKACQLWPSATVLHGAGTSVNGIDFWGIGGGIPLTPFGSWSFDFSDEQAAAMLADCPSGAVLVTHSPQKGSSISTPEGGVGSSAIRQAIEARQPQLVVCGHIHASAGKSGMIGDSTVVNAGPDGILWELN